MKKYEREDDYRIKFYKYDREPRMPGWLKILLLCITILNGIIYLAKLIGQTPSGILGIAYTIGCLLPGAICVTLMIIFRGNKK